MHVRRALGVVVAATVMLALWAGGAGADPKPGQHFGPIQVDCGDAGHFTVVAPGGGQFGVAHDMNSTRVGVVLALQNQTFVYTDPDGNEFPPETDPPAVKGSGKQDGIWCGFSFDIDTGNGQENFSGSGEVKLHITPRS